MKILLPVDGSHYTRRMLAYVAAHDELFARVTDRVVVTVVPPVPGPIARLLPPEVLEDAYREQAEEVLGTVRAFADQNGWRIRALQVVGHAAESIAALAVEEGADLIVMGSHGHSALGNIVLGSVTAGVLSRCRVPVLVVR
ncbi:MAG TPA: universal stress protein [Gemmatimonadales bacterium]|nr:universal stress protein [Gemmatimonadales bacterium]